jgi:hypothetical protein
MDGEHVTERSGDGDQEQDDLKEDAVDEESGPLDISTDPVDEGAAVVGVEEPEGKTLEFIVALGAKVDDETALEEVAEPDAVEVAETES